MDPRLTLEKRIEAELKSYDGMMCIYARSEERRVGKECTG